MFCPHCGKAIPQEAATCPECGQTLAAQPAQPAVQQAPQPDGQQAAAEQPAISPKSRIAFILLAFFLGGLGAHRFYAGRMFSGFCMLALGLLNIICAFFPPIGIFFMLPLSIWGLIDFILGLAGCFKDADGRIIKNW